jgi:hypothetical protein
MVAKMELASAYVTLNVSTKQMGKQIGQMFGQAESQASTTGQKMGRSIQKGLNAASTSTVEDLQKRLTSGEEKLALPRNGAPVDGLRRPVVLRSLRRSSTRSRKRATRRTLRFSRLRIVSLRRGRSTPRSRGTRLLRFLGMRKRSRRRSPLWTSCLRRRRSPGERSVPRSRVSARRSGRRSLGRSLPHPSRLVVSSRRPVWPLAL